MGWLLPPAAELSPGDGQRSGKCPGRKQDLTALIHCADEQGKAEIAWLTSRFPKSLCLTSQSSRVLGRFFGIYTTKHIFLHGTCIGRIYVFTM